MIGKDATLRDIVLEEQPTPLDNLWCDEELAPSDDEEEESPPNQNLKPFRIQTYCGTCGRGIRIVVLCTQDGIHSLESLLCRNTSLCCPTCAATYRFEHGG
ncbi:E7 [Canis familiaris papillomavirus 9]|uniref:Protein E7 n=1 Tax=Canis familiaris papillomavirus 9 TaxID=1087108 RepID=G4XF63_9PAPI|nr:E7 [Canis familiaris papillomavirus 9]AEP82735.1 E7 [Canis familiaris papillomavirus 9]QNS42836.1 E7 [Canis familiaris papillomavirus 9]QNS42843.1 E7 [Canis familiaris papillomavirus 9]